MRLILVLLTAVSLSAQTGGAIIDNDQLRVAMGTATPGQKTAAHDHQFDRVMIYLDPGHQIIDYVDGGETILDWKRGDVTWSPVGPMHVGLLTSDNPSSCIEVEVKKPGKAGAAGMSAQDPLKVDPDHHKLEFENDKVRVYRVKLGPGESTPVHEHALNSVAVYLTDQNLRVTPVDGQPEIQQNKAGAVSWVTPVKHQEENLSDEPLEVVIVEAKS